MPLTLANVELAEKTLAHIRSHEWRLDQSTWLSLWKGDVGVTFERAMHCGSTGCFAGWAALLDGAELSFDEGEYIIKTADGVPVYDYAADALGIPHYQEGNDTIVQADHLFDANNTFEDLEEFVQLMRESYEKSQSDPTPPVLTSESRAFLGGLI